MSDISSTEQQARYYDNRWTGEDYANRLKLIRCVAILEALARIRIQRPRIIELGCGTGWLTAILGHFGPATGLELSPEAVRSARERYRHVTLEAVDLTHWTPPENQFDVVVSHEVLEHLEVQNAHIAQAWKLLVPGGHLILTTPNRLTMEAMPRERYETWSTQPIENWLAPSEVRKLIEDAGFEISRLTTLITGHGVRGTHRLVNSTKLVRMLRALRLVHPYNAFRLRAGYGLHILVVAEKPQTSR